MNRIYKVIWSNVKKCYIVTSEIAKNYSKITKQSSMNRVLTLGVLLSLFGLGFALPVWADPINITSPDGNNPNTVSDDESLVIGKDNIITGQCHIIIGACNDFTDVSINPYDVVMIGNNNTLAYSSNYATSATSIGNQNRVAEGSVAIGLNVNNVDKDYSQYGIGSFAVAVGDRSYTEGDYSVAIGNYSYALGARSVAIGSEVSAFSDNTIAIGNFAAACYDYSVAIGDEAWADNANSVAIGHCAIAACYDSVVIGNSAYAYDEAVAIGSCATTSGSSIAIGYNSNIDAGDAVAVGYCSTITEYDSVALGSYSSVSAVGSVALGACSVANQEYTVSVGDADNSLTRRIVNVTDGVDDNDAATVGQLKQFDNDKVLAGNNIHVAESMDANGVKQFTVSAVVDSSNLEIHGDGTIADNDVRLLSGETVYHEVHVPSDGNYIQSSNTTSQNLMVLDTAVGNIDSTLSDYDLTVKYDTSTKDLLTLSGTSGTKITNLIPATLSEISSDAVIGSQLYTTNQNLATEVTNRTNADTSLSNRIGSLSTNGHYILKDNTVSQNLAILDSYVYNNTSSGGDSGGVSSTTNHFFGVSSTDASDPNYDGLGASGDGSIAIGVNSRATSMNSIAIGKNVLSGGSYFAETRNIALGTDISTWNKGDGTVSIGNYLQNSGGIVVGIHSTVDSGSVAVGTCSEAYESSSAIGSYSVATGRQSASLGVGTIAKGMYGVAVGSFSRVSGPYSLAVGHEAYAHTNVSGNNSHPYGHGWGNVAIGNYSSTGKDDELPDDPIFSIGCKAGDYVNDEGDAVLVTITRRIINVTDGKSATDAATVKQTMRLQNGTNTTIQESGTADNGQSLYKVNVTGNGQINSSNSGLLTGNTVFNEVRVAEDGNYLLQNNTTAQNLNVLDAQIKANADAIANINPTDTVTYYFGVNSNDSTDNNYLGEGATGTNAIAVGSKAVASHANSVAIGYNSEATDDNVVSFGKDAVLDGETVVSPEYTRKLVHIKGGTINETSTDAINGSQLYSVKQDILGYAEDISRNSENIRSLNSSVTSALSSVAASSLLVDTMDASKADASLNNLTDSGKRVLKTYAENAVQEYMAAQGNQSPMAPMVVDNTNNYLTVTDAGNGSLHVGEGSYVNGSFSIAIGVGNQVNANNSGAFGDPSIINADESYVLGNDDTINTGATSSFILGNNGVSDAKGGLLFGSNTKATIDAEDGIALGNQSEVSAKNAIALGSNSIADTENTLSIGNSNLKRKITNVADGDVSQNSSEAVTGAQLFVTNQKVRENTEAIAKKADADANNIVVSDWAIKLGVGKVEDGNSDLVTGGIVYNAIKDIGNNGLVQTNGDTLTIGANSTTSVIDVSNVDGQSRVITGVATDATDATSVANVGYVNAVGEDIINATNRAFQKVDNKINKAGANAAALANLPTPTFEGEEKWAFAAGIGHYQGETAGAVGAFYKPTDNVIARVSGSFGNGDEMVGAGVAVSLNKGNTPVVSKAQLVRTINAQAEQIQLQAGQLQQQSGQIQMQAGQIQQQAGKIEQQANEIAALKAMVADLATKVH